MHDVVVTDAIRAVIMLAMSCNTVFRVSFFFVVIMFGVLVNDNDSRLSERQCKDTIAMPMRASDLDVRKC